MAETEKKKHAWKLYVILFLVAIMLGAFAYGYIWQKNVMSELEESRIKVQASQHVLGELGSLKTLEAAIMKEQKRCTDFIDQGEGNFGELGYCQAFIEWAEKNIEAK